MVGLAAETGRSAPALNMHFVPQQVDEVVSSISILGLGQPECICPDSSFKVQQGGHWRPIVPPVCMAQFHNFIIGIY